jgi:hypothetical protein
MRTEKSQPTGLSAVALPAGAQFAASTKSAKARDSRTVLPNCLVMASRREAMLQPDQPAKLLTRGLDRPARH